MIEEEKDKNVKSAIIEALGKIFMGSNEKEFLEILLKNIHSRFPEVRKATILAIKAIYKGTADDTICKELSKRIRGFINKERNREIRYLILDAMQEIGCKLS